MFSLHPPTLLGVVHLCALGWLWLSCFVPASLMTSGGLALQRDLVLPSCIRWALVRAKPAVARSLLNSRCVAHPPPSYATPPTGGFARRLPIVAAERLRGWEVRFGLAYLTLTSLHRLMR